MALERTQEVQGWGIDKELEARPGVPSEAEPKPAIGSHWQEPERQIPPSYPILKRAGLDKLTPVFGTAQPIHGLSGVLRKQAYTLPDHLTSHWMLLVLADRIDVVESAILDQFSGRRLLRNSLVAGVLSSLVIGAFWLRRK